MEELRKFIYHCEIDDICSNVFIMQCEGKAFVRVSWYNNDNVAFISDLSVNLFSRKKGLGNSILKEAERTIRLFGKEFSQLKVLKNTWMKEWYERLGYSFIDVDKDFCFMIKKLQ